MLSVLRTRQDLRRLFFAHSVSRAGDAFNAVALVVLVFRLTGSGRGVATTVAFEVVPILLLGPVAGSVIDRFPARRVMITADLARAALVAVLALSHTSAVNAFAVAFGLSTGALFFNPAASALMPTLVEPDELVTANSALWTVAVAAQIALAPLAGVVIAAYGVGAAFALNAASYALSAIFLVRLDAGRVSAGAGARGWHAVREGVAAVRTNPLLAHLAMVQVLASLSAGATSGLLIVLATDELDVGTTGFGLLLGAIGVGAVVGPVMLRRFIRPARRTWLFGPYAIRGIVDLVLAATRQAGIAGAALVGYGVSTSTGMIAYQSTLQSEVPEHVRGRAFALFDVLWNAARLVSLGVGGMLADALGIRAVYVVGGVLLFVAALVGARAPLEQNDALRS